MNQIKINTAALEAARKQFCLDTCLSWQEYQENPYRKCYIQKTVYAERFPAAEGARRYNGNDAYFKAIICMGQLFLTVDEEIYDWAVEKFSDCAPEWFCAYGNLRMIDDKLREHGRKIADTHIYYLPEAEPQENLRKAGMQDRSVSESEEAESQSKPVSESEKAEQLPFQWYEADELLVFKENNRFTSAICFSPTQPDMLAVVAMKDIQNTEAGQCIDNIAGENAEKGKDKSSICKQAQKGVKCYDQDCMAGMAGVSADGEYLWQIGINVIEEYAGRGLAAKLVKALKEEIFRRGKVPFYGTSESHTISQTVALKSGFVPAWTELYVQPL